MRPLLVIALLSTSAFAAPLRSVKFSSFEGICAIRADDKLVCEKASARPTFDGPIRDLVSTYTPLVVQMDGSLVRSGKKPEPIAVGFKIRAAGTVGTGKTRQLCVLGEKGELACGPYADAMTKLEAKPVAGTFVDIHFGSDSMWALDDRGALWCAGGIDCARVYRAASKRTAKLVDVAHAWPRPLDTVDDAPLWHVTDGVKRMYATGSPCFDVGDQLVCMGFNQGPTVVARPAGDELLTVGAWLCARTGDRIACTLHDSKSSLVVKGAVRMHAAFDRFCVENAQAELACAAISNPIPALQPLVWAK